MEIIIDINPVNDLGSSKKSEKKAAKGCNNYEAYTLSEQMLDKVNNRLNDKEKRKELRWMQRHDIKKQAKILQKKLSRIKPDCITDQQVDELLIQREILELTVGKWLE